MLNQSLDDDDISISDAIYIDSSNRYRNRSVSKTKCDANDVAICKSFDNDININIESRIPIIIESKNNSLDIGIVDEMFDDETKY